MIPCTASSVWVDWIWAWQMQFSQVESPEMSGIREASNCSSMSKEPKGMGMGILHPLVMMNKELEFNVQLLVGVLAALAAMILLQILHRNASGSKFDQCRERRDKKLPPGPRPWPVVGNLLQTGPVPHEKTRQMNAQFGPIVFLRLGCVPAIVTDDPAVVKAILKNQDSVFASRPANIASQHFTFGGRDIAFAPYGAHWRSMRRICTLELLTPKRLEAFQRGRTDEAGLMVRSVFDDCTRNRNPVIGLRDRFGALASNNLTRMLLGKRFFGPGDSGPRDAAEHKAMIYDAFALVNGFNVADYLPFLRWLDIHGHERRMRKIMARTNAIYDAIIEEHRSRKRRKTTDDDDPMDFVDVLLSLPGQREVEKGLSNTVIKAILIDMAAAGTDTTSITSEWTMAELIRHPDIMANVRYEIDSVVGLERVVEESDLKHFRYLRAVVKEVLRLHPVGAFLIPHVSMEETKLFGYDIPKNTRALINTYSLGRNPAVWKDPLQFRPERFMEEHVELFDPEYRMVPFGAGRRGCPGASLGTCMVLLGVSRLVHSFDWSPPNGTRPEDVETRLAYNSMILEKPLELLASPRLAEHLY